MNTNDHSRSLIVRLPNWVGDTMMALPALLQLADSGVKLHFVGKGWASNLLAGLGQDITSLPKSYHAQRECFKAIGFKANVPCRYGLLFPNSFSSALTMRSAGIRTIGYPGHTRSLFLSHPVHHNSANVHEVEISWQLGQAAHQILKIDAAQNPWPDHPPEYLHLPLADTAYAEASAVLNAFHVRGPYIVVCPLAVGTTLGESRIWPHFQQLAKYLIQNGNTLVACPGPGEEVACLEALPGAVILPQLKLATYAAVMHHAEQVIANNSGPMHMAAATQTPVLGIFAPGDIERTRPWGGQFITGSKTWPCLDQVIDAIDSLPMRTLKAAG